jgi:uncharacterized protein
MVKQECCSGSECGSGSECCSSGCGKMAVVVVLLLALGMLGSAYVLSKGDYAPVVNVANTPVEHAISVSATASEKVSPDLLVIQLHVQTDAKTAKQAVQDNAAVTADLLASLKALGLSDQDIQTTSYSVDQVTETNYTCDPRGYNCVYNYRVTGYKVTNSISLQVKDLAKGGDVIDASSSAGTNQTFIDSVGFTLQDETRRTLEKGLLRNAAAEAKAKAQNMAEGSGASLGKLLSVSQSSSYYPQPLYRDYAMVAEAGSAPKTELSAGQVEVSVTVGASYQIG